MGISRPRVSQVITNLLGANIFVRDKAEALGMAQHGSLWQCCQRLENKYDPEPTQPHKNLSHLDNFYGYNVWGFRDET
ncbi:hypothetical protein ES703_18925 [subsurface metagenome]